MKHESTGKDVENEEAIVESSVNPGYVALKNGNSEIQYSIPTENFVIGQTVTKDELRKIIKDRLKEDQNADLNDIDVSNITDMSYLFFELDPHNIDVSEWDVSNVRYMNYVFDGCEKFNSDLSNWDVSNVKDMEGMFWKCANFNSDLSRWNVSNVENMSYMFWMCKNFNANLNNWNVSNVENMIAMFSDCDSMKKLPEWFMKH